MNKFPKDIRPRNSHRTRQYIESHRVVITQMIDEEFKHNTIKKVYDRARSSGYGMDSIVRFTDDVLEQYNLIKKDKKLPDERGSFLERVNAMYGNIWKDRDKNSDLLDCWARIKHGPKKGDGTSDENKWKHMADKKKLNLVDKGPPEENDRVILATAAKFGYDDGRVELVTSDNDFILFTDYIERDFNVNIVNGFRL